MKSFFNKRFDEEFLLSEKLRTKILACMFLFGAAYSAVVLLVFDRQVPDELKNGASVRIFLFLVSLSLFEMLWLAYINKHIRRNSERIPLAGQYLNAALEIMAPAVIMLLLAVRLPASSHLIHSPTVYICFIFIVLSTLRLNFYISLFMGVLAAAEVLAINHFLISQAKDIDPSHIRAEYFTATGKSILLLLSGIGAAFVARQIRLSVDRSLSVAEQQNKIIGLFGQQVSKEVVDEMIRGGVSQTRLMRVCIMFIDIRNFTSYVADKTPSEIVAYQNAFFEIIVKTVIRHHGIINQFLGDGCMVTFGAPVALHNPSAHAMNAALEIRQQLELAVAAGKLPPTSIGVGIHEGDAVTGNIGPVERQQYSITGSVVILAARIEQLNKEYNSQILVSENVIEKINANILTATEYLGKVKLKGWTNDIGIYKVA